MKLKSIFNKIFTYEYLTAEHLNGLDKYKVSLIRLFSNFCLIFWLCFFFFSTALLTIRHYHYT